MFELTVQEEMWSELQAIAKFKLGVSKKVDSRDMAKHMKPRTPEEELQHRLESCLAEYTVSQWTGQVWHAYDIWLEYGPDVPEDLSTARKVHKLLSGIDVGEDIEVRSKSRPGAPLIVRDRDGLNNNIYVLVYVDTEARTGHVRGWLLQHEARTKGVRRKDDYYECSPELLRTDSLL